MCGIIRTHIALRIMCICAASADAYSSQGLVAADALSLVWYTYRNYLAYAREKYLTLGGAGRKMLAYGKT